MIGKLLKLYRNVNDIGIRELSKELGISRATLSRIERKNICDSKIMLKIINWLFSINEE